ncbi:hypothetical protein SCB49_08463 [unidentified eubacterium SCB49]|nr:hypothetical protein SCB49_08463 [unidentified eubacterium SCB49]
MKKNITLNIGLVHICILIICILSTNTIYSQVGVNTTTPENGAILDIESTDKGIFIPRVNIADLSTIAPITGIAGAAEEAAAASLLVYNTNTTTGEGYHYWDGTDFIPLRILPVNDDWKLTGNAGTVPGTNYLGTSDSVDLIIKTDDTERMRLLANGQVSVNDNTPAAGNRFSVLGAANEFAINGFASANGVGIVGQNNGTGSGVLAQNTGNGFGLISLNSGSSIGFYNQVATGLGILNQINSNNFGIYTDLTAAGGIGEYILLDDQDGNGVFVDAATSGDVYAFNGSLNTTTATTGTTVNGTVYAGSQNGKGHGMIILHAGSEGRNSEFNTLNASNTDPSIFSVNIGQGSAILGQNQNNTISGTISVADFAYTGTDNANHIGVSGYSQPRANRGIGVRGEGGNYGVFAQGDLGASGTKSFTIDHPQDPANKILKHFSIESNEVLNIYRGVDTFDANGYVKVTMPDYYFSINKNASYQLTPIGAAMPNLYIEKEIDGTGTFIIAGGEPGKKVSWSLTAERNDPYLIQNPERRKVVIEKEGERKGKYLTPELYGQPKSKSMFSEIGKKQTPSTIREKTSVEAMDVKKPTIAVPTQNLKEKNTSSVEKNTKDSPTQENKNLTYSKNPKNDLRFK